MKRFFLPLAVALLLLCTSALADEAGVLTETELSAWLNKLLLSTVGVQPLNAPVGEESLTDDGYALMYPTATLYYNQPTLNAQSKLQAVAVTDEALDMPRGIRLGAPESMLLAAYGWQNPTLAGDDTFAPLYVLNQLPDSAYWAWAQRSGDQLQSVRCAIHAGVGAGRYTDTGILYTLNAGLVDAIRIYGLNRTIDQTEVESNLAAVGGVPTAGADQGVAGVTVQSDAEPFGARDMKFGGMDVITLTEKGAGMVFGDFTGEEWAQDEQNAWLHTLVFPDATLVFGMDQQKQNPRLESLTLRSGDRIGPRGLMLGGALDKVLELFRCDGTGAVSGSAALLYGDGQNPPYGTLEQTGQDATLRYAAVWTDTDGATVQVALHLTFTDAKLAEIMLYRF
ncbi:MAG TPA: hypothetical protein PLP25_11785 [Candidatus Limiplasma sp.]|nr:hypothetical protein [Candidatus Limiplasma sp.]HPS82527.1 hypothetical protein [Candidatus Limiplasma sp.]